MEETVKMTVMPLIPLRGLTVFPEMGLHFDIGREKSIVALERAMMMNQTVFLVSQKDAETDLPTVDDFYHIGTIAKIKQMLKMPGDNIRVLVEGVCRGEIDTLIKETPYFKARVKQIPEQQYPEGVPTDLLALMRMALQLYKQYLRYQPKEDNRYNSASSVKNPGRLADVIATGMDVKIHDKQVIMAEVDPGRRLEKVCALLTNEIEILRMQNEISAKVKESVNRNQKEYYLREQMKAIQEELGNDEDIEDELNAWEEKLEKVALPESVQEKVVKEMKRYRKMPQSSAESGVIRSYIDWILDLPWNVSSQDNIDVIKAKEILEEDHYGLDKVKDRVLEYLSVMKLAGELKGPILCLVGPPGVGKTSIAKSVARSIDRKFVRMSLGGVRDEAEIRGHRRTYIGAIPGRIMSGIKEAGTNNPVFLFDEVDKIGADYKGDPASALLEVLDPEQNKDFMDHYLEIPFDLSKVMFITTANTIDTIPRPLLDRMEVIEVTGYTEEDKVQIADKYLVPKKVKENGLADSNVTVTEGAIRTIINDYTRESGVRNLEREISNVCRKVARQVVETGKAETNIDVPEVRQLLGKRRYHYDKVEGVNEIGVTTGMAWTIVGGDTLFIETTVVPGNGKLVLTGQLGEVMQESAKAGISYIRARAKELGINENFYKENDIHIHIPEGATPKDGPSAGVTMCTSVISALTSTPVHKDVSMTGEITLRGKVLPVGGIREKVLAAHRAGIKKILLPKENESDIDEIPENVRKQLTFVLLETVDDALREALVRPEKNTGKQRLRKA
ncbi:MAG: endopeptidase La [Firmicutes bacterium]|nr:endopeptidase La [Bacillota bacterium]MBR7148365.1 endopeptidase La [Bacillota bacterium]